jgi:UDP-N-acetylmuramoyl-tripeptide--D-alanyl-D-alanine ligase
MSIVAAVVVVLSFVAALLRWLRVSQREHYLRSACSSTLVRFLQRRPPNLPAWVVALAASVWALTGATGWEVGAVVAAVGVILLPWPLPVWSRQTPLAFTPRTRRLAAASVAIIALVVVLNVAIGVPVGTLAVIGLVVPVIVDEAAALMQPVERKLAEKFRAQAEQKLRSISPRVVAVTGSYGKTSTKNHIRDLVAGSFPTVASPASWNNQNGLARTINEHLDPGTEVLVAEMGTYGPGEIRAMCAWVPPEIAIITAIGPMHLERMKTLDVVLEAKREILDGARVAILNVDDERLAALADGGLVTAELWRCGTAGTRPDLDVAVEVAGDDQVVHVRGTEVGRVPAGAGLHAGNVACAVAAAVALGVPPTALAPRLAALTLPEHRAVAATADSGVVVLDDTFNSNPLGAHAALRRLTEAVPAGRRAVVTPGMVELGPEQDAANEAFAEAIAGSGSTLVAVGWTNRRALLTGAARGARDGEVVVVPSRDAAREWVRAHLASGDGVLWENDLPDHYP